MGAKPSRSGHLPINGLNLYYEVYGELGTPKPPLLLIPGAFMASGSMTVWAEAFARDRTVVVFDQQGHGRTRDTSREMSYEQFADDAAALLLALEVERADVMGYSQGGGVALQLAIRHPRLVSKLVSLSATYRKDGWYPSVFEAHRGPRCRRVRRYARRDGFQGAHARRRCVRRLPREDEGVEHQRSGHQRRGDALDLGEDDGHCR